MISPLLKSNSVNYYLLLAFGFSIIFAVVFGILLEEPLLAVFPPAILVGLLAIFNIKHFYYFFFATLPFSIEIFLPNGLGTDLPSEPLMLAICFIAILMGLQNITLISKKYLTNPLSLLIIAHMVWIFMTSIFAEDPIVSMKYFLAKTWYVIPFYFFSLYLFKEKKDIYRLFKILLISLFFAAMYVFIRHSFKGFTFDSISKAGSPIFRNHVSYAAILSLSMPYLWALWKNTQSTLQKRIIVFVGMFFLVAIYLTFTRAAYVTLLIAVGAYYVLKYRFVKHAISFSIIAAIVGVSFFLNDNRYLDFAPDFEKTITHDKFGNLIEATYKMEDLSTMERVYRWVAGVQMIKDRPILGFGPGNFYFNYQGYSVSSFKTYVSNNPDKSGIHNYYLMTFVEQGFLGFLIILALVFVALIMAENVYHRLTDESEKYLVMAAFLSLIIIDAFILINDLLETDKVGTFFFVNTAIIAIFHIRVNSKDAQEI